nr:immunoglobulin light chain junction region [Macaca mulatta]MOX17075.1 immunoglobulin light chain junction region [Macaca mulatta]MOX17307.1 immunoglobulin light chain junction region [Macaca mulatta]MOX18050.1 immunoglobulin light chain junction region [Macaca mulatta]MOX18139.1 immunoglobulin light chain junction region [Macaca mulatta]
EYYCWLRHSGVYIF